MRQGLHPTPFVTVCATIGLLMVTAVVRTPARALASTGDTDCFSSFALGTSDRVCVTDHGNIGSWTSYGSGSHFEAEGYTVCDGDVPGTYYQDIHGTVEFGWDDSIISQPKGRNTFPLAIQRDTVDGVWRLLQTFTAKQHELRITMQLTNLTGVTRNVRILRRADLRMNGSHSVTAVRFDRTVDAVWVRSESGVSAMTLRGVPVTTGHYSTHVKAGDLSPGIDCAPGTDPAPGIGFDVFTWVSFPPIAVRPGLSITRTALYARM